MGGGKLGGILVEGIFVEGIQVEGIPVGGLYAIPHNDDMRVLGVCNQKVIHRACLKPNNDNANVRDYIAYDTYQRPTNTEKHIHVARQPDRQRTFRQRHTTVHRH